MPFKLSNQLTNLVYARQEITCQDDIYTQSKQAAQSGFPNASGCLQALIADA